MMRFLKYLFKSDYTIESALAVNYLVSKEYKIVRRYTGLGTTWEHFTHYKVNDLYNLNRKEIYFFALELGLEERK